jgi:ribosomal-protein-alanine N-acetyltransferase
MSVVLFNFATDDVAHLATLHAASFEAPWDRVALAGLLASPGAFAFHHPNGFVLARAAGGEAEILTLAVAPAARCRGLGRALMMAAASHSQELGADALFLEVGVSNPAALALYAGLGFVKVGMRRGYYGGPGPSRTGSRNPDAAVLRLPLPAEFA